MAKFSSKGLLGIAMVLSFILALLVYNYLNGVQQKSAGQAAVVVAKVEIPPNTLITEEMIEKIPAQDQQLQPGAKVDTDGVVGVYTKERIPAREQITEKLIFGEGKSARFTGAIPADKRAVSVSVNDVTGVAGLIRPNDYVDVIVTLDRGGAPVASMNFQNALVLATNKIVAQNDTEKGSAGKDEVKVSTVTLALTPDDATLLALAGAKGTVSLALRPYSPVAGGVSLVGVKTLDSLSGGEYTPPVPAPAQAASPRPEFVAEDKHTRSISVIKGTKVEEISVY